MRPHLPRRTVRLRLTLMYGCLFLVVGAGLLGITYALVRNATDSAYVYTGPNGATGAVFRNPDGTGRAITGSTSRQASGTSSTNAGRKRSLLQVQGLDGSGNLTPKQLELQAKRLEKLAEQQHETELRQLLTQSGIALGIMTVVSIALGWFMAGRVLRPLRTITTTARTISATNLHERLALRGPDDELKELGDTFDELLGRLERSFDAQRAFVANASHELRTPLARQRAVVQVALADPDATVDSLRAAHERVLAAGEQQERLIEALLTLTRGQAGLTKREAFDLATITRSVLDSRATEADLREITVDARLASAPTSGSPGLVERLVVNLVDNALRHNAPHGRIEIVTGTRNGAAVLSIRNDGPLVPTSEIERIFLPLQRLDATRLSQPDGLGLGLSIVKAIADTHGASITARGRPEGGLAIDVSFVASLVPPTDAARPRQVEVTMR